jgi:hypothetical protein
MEALTLSVPPTPGNSIEKAGQPESVFDSHNSSTEKLSALFYLWWRWVF